MESKSKLVELPAGGVLALSGCIDGRVNLPYQASMIIEFGGESMKLRAQIPGAGDRVADRLRRFQRCGDPDEIHCRQDGPFRSRPPNRLPDVKQLVKWKRSFPGQQRPELFNLVPDFLRFLQRGEWAGRLCQLPSHRRSGKGGQSRLDGRPLQDIAGGLIDLIHLTRAALDGFSRNERTFRVRGCTINTTGDSISSPLSADHPS